MDTTLNTVALKRRSEILATADDLINGERDASYGDALDSFTRIAKLWTATLGIEISPTQVALLLAQLKLARLAASPTHEDSWIDLAGYAALGGEIAHRTPPVSTP